MKKYIIITDSCSDLGSALREKYDIQYAPMHYVCEGEDHIASLDLTDEEWHEFYESMRNGKRMKTAQVAQKDFEIIFEKAINDGYDVLYIACASGLSASIHSSRIVRDELLAKYPDAKIVCVDSLNSCMGLGILCITAAEMRAAGKSIDEVAAWLEEHKLEMHQEATVDKLTYLKQAGRVSATSAFFGGLLNIKPIIISNVKGENQAVEKVKGRHTSIVRLAERMQEDYRDVPYQKVFVVHADCLDELQDLKKEIVARIPALEGKIETSWIGPCVGISVGPGTMAVYFFGNEVTTTSEK